MHNSFRPIVWLLSGAVVACNGEPLGPINGLPRELSVAEQHLIEADNRFAFKLFQEINRQEEPGKNVFISPLSVAMALGMTYNGARAATQEAMAKTLELQGMSIQEVNESYRSLIDLLRSLDPKVDFRIANSIWYRLGLPVRQEFIDLNRAFFDAAVRALDFQRPDAPDTINDWVKTNTSGKIEKIIDVIPDEIVMYLINAIYFNGSWTYRFDKDKTQRERFQLADGGDTEVPMMYRGNAPLRLYAGNGFTAADLPYGGDAFSMTILLPDPGHSVSELAAQLDRETWNTMIAGLRSDSIQVVMPTFKLEYDLTMNDVLKALGMEIAFKPYQADLSGIGLAPGDLYISYVKHKAFVDVHEEGTEAAAVTVVGIGIVCACGPPVFRVDRPFIFAIRERHSGTILFMGKVMNPAT